MRLPPYFTKADPDDPCDGCGRVRGLCKFCSRCRECCQCCPRFICPRCHGRDITVAEGSDMARELPLCRCEPCAGGCGRVVQDPDEGFYFSGDQRPWCYACYKRMA